MNLPGPKPRSGFRGITYDTRDKRWIARIWLPDLRASKNLGAFKAPEQAARAFDAAAREYRPDLPLNFPEDSLVPA